MVALAGAGSIALGAAAATAFAPEPRLALLDEQGRVLLRQPRSDAPLTIRYRHSVALTTVEEDFVPAADGQVAVVATRFASFGAGLPAQPEWGGTFSAPPGEPFSVAGMSARFPQVVVRVGYRSQQTAVVDDGTGGGARAVRLDSLVAPGATVTLRTVSRPRLAWWLEGPR